LSAVLGRALAGCCLVALCLSAWAGCGSGEPDASEPRSTDGGASARGGKSGKGPRKPACIGCHLDDYEGARRHVNVKPETCGVCHREDHWHPTILKHPWPLTGAHTKTNCFKCHTGKPPVYKGTPRACVACHRDELDAQNKESPSHALGGVACEQCHSTNRWSEWPGHPDSDREPPPDTAPGATPSATPTPPPTDVPAPTAKPVPTARAVPTSKPYPTTKPGTTAAPTASPKATSTAKANPKPSVITGASRK
jgi:hypothetical protein